ncbi:MAG: 50S ribosomal protein L31 [Candidatus Gracilibacteria bacterium]|jgi:large subunit ribosomal protein L31|nr:50S ribosomal protein L31 [Candidatus Gracilibacteria bacterium]
MQKGIHPDYHDGQIACVCGASIKVGSTKPEINTEICSQCHPFFTGKQKLVDTEGRVQKFKDKWDKARKN